MISAGFKWILNGDLQCSDIMKMNSNFQQLNDPAQFSALMSCSPRCSGGYQLWKFRLTCIWPFLVKSNQIMDFRLSFIKLPDTGHTHIVPIWKKCLWWGTPLYWSHFEMKQTLLEQIICILLCLYAGPS